MTQAFIVIVVCLTALPTFGTPQLKVSSNRISVGKIRGDVAFRETGDLNGDGKIETVFTMRMNWSCCNYMIVVGRKTTTGWQTIASEEPGGCDMRTDVTDVNGDGKDEVVVRGWSGDGHGLCYVYASRNGKLISLAPLGNFNATRFLDLSGDGIPEVLSVSMISFGFIGDHWLTIYKWNGKGYTDVSRRFPRAYDDVIRDLKRLMHDLEFTKRFGDKITAKDDPEIFADIHFYLGKAYEYRGFPQKAKKEYTVAKKLRDRVKAMLDKDR